MRWAQDVRYRMVSLQAQRGTASGLAMKAQEMIARIRGLFGSAPVAGR